MNPVVKYLFYILVTLFSFQFVNSSLNFTNPYKVQSKNGPFKLRNSGLEKKFERSRRDSFSQRQLDYGWNYEDQHWDNYYQPDTFYQRTGWSSSPPVHRHYPVDHEESSTYQDIIGLLAIIGLGLFLFEALVTVSTSTNVVNMRSFGRSRKYPSVPMSYFDEQPNFDNLVKSTKKIFG